MAHWFTHRTAHAPAQPAPPVSPGVRNVDHKQLLRLLNFVQGAVYLPGDAGYPDAARQFDSQFLRRPIAVVVCADVADVQACLLWCHQLGVTPTFRSGGHSTAGYSVLDNTLTVDLSLLNRIEIDPDARIAHVQPGVNFDQLNAALDQHQLHVPGGGCGSVCVAGYMQGGGYGFTSRSFGMNCDNVREIEFLTREGSRQIANATSNPELFWAIRGGTGGNFGVVTRITYDLVPLGTIWGFGLRWDLDHAAKAMQAMQAGYMRAGPASIGYMTFIIGRRDQGTGDYKTALFMRGMCVEGAAKGRSLLEPLLQTGAAYEIDTEGSYSYLNGFLLADLEPTDLGIIQELKVSNYVAKKLAAADWAEVVDCFRKAPGFAAAHANTLTLEPYGGRIAETSARTDNAFMHREVDMNFAIDSFFGTNDERPAAQAWLQRFTDFLRGPLGRSNGEVYQNYPEPDLTNWREAYFGKNFDRLLKLKQEVDPPGKDYPKGFFTFPQSIFPKE